jgi:hypothetical protein
MRHQEDEMNKGDDGLLLREINAFAGRAEENKFSRALGRAIVLTLGAHLSQLSPDEIEAKLKDVWISRKLTWMD